MRSEYSGGKGEDAAGAINDLGDGEFFGARLDADLLSDAVGFGF